MQACQRALSIEPGSPVAHLNVACILLAMGRFPEGWAAYEHRFAVSKSTWVRSDVKALPWTGETLRGRSILILGEQANGDYIQFARYLPLLCDLGASVTFFLPARLVRLMSSLRGDITLVDKIPTVDRFDYQCALMSLPHRFTGLDQELPSDTPYLFAEPERLAKWGERIGHHGFRIGIAWKGNRYPGGDLNRSFPLDMLLPVARIPNVRLISLQVGPGTEEIPHLPPDMPVETLGEDYDVGDHGFLDAAAVMKSVDLVISLDSSLAHLAGALGAPLWIALTYAPEWRWQRERTDTPWYPTAQLFRQHAPGDWDGIFTRMAAALQDMVVDAPACKTVVATTLPSAPVSWGELLDKITILDIKEQRLASAEAVANVTLELGHLRKVADGAVSQVADVGPEVERLRAVNEKLWDVEDALRQFEAEERFDGTFIGFARSVYVLNDERARIKRRINVLLNSEIVEQKSYGQTSVTGTPGPAGHAFNGSAERPAL